jgi:nifR3 family TIM-barrel protein
MLAPIAGYCDLAFRIVARSLGGVGLASTDLLSPHGLMRGKRQSLDLARTHAEDQPICMQLYGCDADILRQGASWAIQHGATVIDINMGCPVDKVAKKNGGSLLLRDPCATCTLFEKLATHVERESAGRVPLTAKLRLGWDDDSIVAPRLARDLERAGAQLITIHGRTTEQRFRGSVRIEGIGEVVEATDAIPVVGNGDIKCAQDALRMMEHTGCDGVMIGRGMLSRPWLARDIWALQTTSEAPQSPSVDEQIDMIRRYFELMLQFRYERYAMVNIQRRISWFGKALGPCKPLKERVRLSKTPDDVRAALEEYRAGGLRLFPREDRSEDLLSA